MEVGGGSFPDSSTPGEPRRSHCPGLVDGGEGMSTCKTRVAVLAGIAAFGFVLAGRAAPAEEPGRHPNYVHARNELAQANKLLHLPEDGDVHADLHAAIEEVDQAIAEIDRAAVLDRKAIEADPQVDTGLRCLPKYREIFHLLHAAQHNVSLGEDDPRARGLRDRARGHIEEALKHVRHAVLLDEPEEAR
jgi:tetratricopeptide (TPR) repeat protein